ncbi:lactonase family protein [Paenibacillus periandrae]|uniref:lactonase family protein n=1 Tax=Paenibacillus periandrae TaxID=1761741 RepID=UPI001F09E26C|nr:lactonase family protein [Paenibacillus periandrae]
MHYSILVGTYTGAGDVGIHMLELDSSSGRLQYVNGYKGIQNPSFLAVNPQMEVVYAVSETEEGAVVALKFNRNSGVFEEINRQPTYGSYPCHLQTDEYGKWICSVNYGSGSINVYPLNKDGSIGTMTDQIHHKGRSIRNDRQESSHPHSVNRIPNTNQWLVPDLGNDKLYLYGLKDTAGKWDLVSMQDTFQGHGPRHVAFHPRLSIAYVLEELSSTVGVYRIRAGDNISANSKLTLERIQTVSALPKTYDSENISADIHITPDGKFLYASNRGHDSLVIYSIHEDGGLHCGDHFSTGGKTPRNFSIVGNEPYLVVANQDSDSILLFDIEKEGRIQKTTQTISIHRPSCVCILNN